MQADAATQALATAIADQRAVAHAIEDQDASFAREVAQAAPQPLVAWRAAVNAHRAQLSSALVCSETQVGAARETLRARLSLLELTKMEVSRRERLHRRDALTKQQLELDEIGQSRVSPKTALGLAPPDRGQ
jgi:hypothetical protein